MTLDEANEGHALQERLSPMLDGVKAGDEAQLLAVLAEMDLPVDELEVALARRTGTDLLAAIAIAYELRRMAPSAAYFQVIRGPAKRANLVLTPSGDRMSVDVPLSTEARWSKGVLTIARVLPNTFQIAVQDKPLSQVVSHPLLDPLGLKVVRTEILNGRETAIHTDHVGTMRRTGAFTHDELASDESALDTPPPTRRTGRTDLQSPF